MNIILFSHFENMNPVFFFTIKNIHQIFTNMLEILLGKRNVINLLKLVFYDYYSKTLSNSFF